MKEVITGQASKKNIPWNSSASLFATFFNGSYQPL
jgi:hypothetical protein